MLQLNPLFDKLRRTPGITLKECRNLHPIRNSPLSLKVPSVISAKTRITPALHSFGGEAPGRAKRIQKISYLLPTCESTSREGLSANGTKLSTCVCVFTATRTQ